MRLRIFGLQRRRLTVGSDGLVGLRSLRAHAPERATPALSLRQRGWWVSVGGRTQKLLRIRLIRPWPAAARDSSSIRTHPAWRSRICDTLRSIRRACRARSRRIRVQTTPRSSLDHFRIALKYLLQQRLGPGKILLLNQALPPWRVLAAGLLPRRPSYDGRNRLRFVTHAGRSSSLRLRSWSRTNQSREDCATAHAAAPARSTATASLRATIGTRVTIPVQDTRQIFSRVRSGSLAIASGVPTPTTLPPRLPPSGPRSITQSAVLMTSRLCSMTTIDPPASIRRRNAARSLLTSSKCSPVVGSSKM